MLFEDDRSKTAENTTTQGSSGKSSSVYRRGIKPIVINGRDDIYSLAFLVDGKHVVGGGEEGKIQRWRVEDGKEVGMCQESYFTSHSHTHTCLLSLHNTSANQPSNLAEVTGITA